MIPRWASTERGRYTIHIIFWANLIIISIIIKILKHNYYNNLVFSRIAGVHDAWQRRSTCNQAVWIIKKYRFSVFCRSSRSIIDICRIIVVAHALRIFAICQTSWMGNRTAVVILTGINLLTLVVLNQVSVGSVIFITFFAVTSSPALWVFGAIRIIPTRRRPFEDVTSLNDIISSANGWLRNKF